MILQTIILGNATLTIFRNDETPGPQNHYQVWRGSKKFPCRELIMESATRLDAERTFREQRRRLFIIQKLPIPKPGRKAVEK